MRLPATEPLNEFVGGDASSVTARYIGTTFNTGVSTDSSPQELIISNVCRYAGMAQTVLRKSERWRTVAETTTAPAKRLRVREQLTEKWRAENFVHNAVSEAAVSEVSNVRVRMSALNGSRRSSSGVCSWM